MEYSQLVEFSTAEDMKSAMNEALSEEAAAENPAPAPVSDIDVYSQPAESVAPQTEEAPKTENIDDLLKMI
jgi:hypothetical protein